MYSKLLHKKNILLVIVLSLVAFITFYKPLEVSAACTRHSFCTNCWYGPGGCLYSPFSGSYKCICNQGGTPIYCARGTCEHCSPPGCPFGYSQSNNYCGGDITNTCTRRDCGGNCGTDYRYCYKLKYTVTYNGNGGTCSPSSRSICYLATSAAPSCSRTGYHITSFSRTAGSGGSLNTSTGAVTSVSGTQTITANWARNQYTVTFDGNGGTCVPSSQSVYYGDNSSVPSCTLSGYHITGFTRTAGSGGTLNTSTGQVTSVTGSQTITPTWVLSNLAPTAPTSLRTDTQTNPTDVTNINPQFTAIYNDPDTSDTSGYYQIQVNTSSTFNGTSMWDSGKTAMTTTSQGSRSPNITYNGTTLTYNGVTYYWRIKFWDNSDAEGAWSDPANFTMDIPTSSYYEIEVNTSSDFTGTVMWDSGKTSMTTTTAGQRSPTLTYNGTPLTGAVTYYWRIRFWDMVDNVSPWSDVSTFEINRNPTSPTDLLTEGATNPERIVTASPKFSAIYNDPDSADSSSYYEIEINSASNFTGTVMWDSGKTAMTATPTNSRTPDITYAGDPLQIDTKYYWRIRLWDSNENESPWSSTAEFTMNYTPLAPTNLQTEQQTNPIKVYDNTPEFSATYNDPDSTDSSSNYQIEVNSSSDFSGTTMWDSTKSNMTTTTKGSRSPEIPYAGTVLSPGEKYYWRIKFWDAGDAQSPWSTSANFIMSGPPTASELQIIGETDPNQIVFDIYFSSLYTDPNLDNSSAYQIQINSSNLFNGTTMWDSTKTAATITSGSRSPDIQYNGTPLDHDGTTYYIRMRYWDIDDNVSDWIAGQFIDTLKRFQLDGLQMNGIQLN